MDLTWPLLIAGGVMLFFSPTRRVLGWFVGASFALLALLLFCEPDLGGGD